MKTTKFSQPFNITDKNQKLLPHYYTLICGLQNNQLDIVKSALTHKVDVNKLFLTDNQVSPDDITNKEKFDLTCALDFARETCTPAIYQAVMESIKLTPVQKHSMVLKALASVEKHEDVSKNKELQAIISKYITKQNINSYHQVANLNDPTSLDEHSSWYDYSNCEATFLHVACYTSNNSLIQQLISLGADVNLRLKKKHGTTTAQIVCRNTPNKGDQSHSVNCLVTLLNAGINLDLKDNEKTSGWESIINRFKIPELRKIFANHQPTSLATIEMVKAKSRPLMAFWEKQTGGKGFTRYPLIDDVFKYEHRKIELTREVSKVENLEKFLKHKSLKKALDQRYGFSSSRLSALITKKLFNRNFEHKVVIEPTILQVADWLKILYTENNTLNTSDFLEVLEGYAPTYEYKQGYKDTTLESLNDDFNNNYRADKKRVLEFKTLLKACYTQSQWKGLLLSKAELNDSVTDIYNMYKKFTKELDLVIKRTKFSDIDSLQKLHDLVSGEVKTLQQADFPLNQETVNPHLKALSKVKMTLGYGVKLAESNHELIRWGAQMGHCVGGGDYADDAKNGETIILAITHENEPQYCIELSPDGDIRQVQGKSYARPAKPVMEEFIKELQKQKILKKTEKASRWGQR